jgi:hypothetical protein
MVVNFYDLIIFPALWLENVVFRALSKDKEEKGRTPGKDANEKKSERTSNSMEETAPCKEATEKERLPLALS